MIRYRLDILYTSIGRGHPSYLDGIVELLLREPQIALETSDVFEHSRGISNLSWRLARTLYKIGSTDSVVGRAYNRLRDSSNYNNPSTAMNIMGRDIKKKYIDDRSPLIVAHPLLVGIFSGRRNLVYQHGELAVPRQAVVSGADYVFVPTESAARPFIEGGYSKSQVIVTGLCIEPCLQEQAEEAFEKRLTRIESSDVLTGAFFSSGAEPRPHVENMILAAASIVELGHKAIIFAKHQIRVPKEMIREFEDRNLEFTAVSNYSEDIDTEAGAILCINSTREDEAELTCRLFENLDFFVAPSHERTNWAMGLGLPMFILEPAIGPFSPINREILLQSGVAESLKYTGDAYEFGNILNELRRDQKLKQMSEAGWGKRPITGFQTITDFLVNKLV